MEEKKTLFAVIIIGLILIFLPYYWEWAGLTPKPEENPPEKQFKPSDTPNLTENSIAKSSSFSQDSIHTYYFSPNELPSEAEQVIVQTPFQRLSFTSQGGALTSCRLIQYHRLDGSEVELIPSDGKEFIISLKQRDQIFDLSEIQFIPDRKELFLEKGEQGNLRFIALLPKGQYLEKFLTFSGDHYGFELNIIYRGFEEDTEAFLSWNKGIAFTEKEPQIDWREARTFANFNDKLTTVRVKDADDEDTWGPYKGNLSWVGVRNKYFLSALIPRQDNLYRITLKGKGKQKEKIPDYSYEVGIYLEKEGTWKNIVYLGPLEYDNLIQYKANLEQAIDFGWPVVSQISKLLLIAFKASYRYIPNYGWIIILFAIVIKILVYPLTHKTNESTAKMHELQPKIAALREKYKNDRQRLSRETMKLYKEAGINPLGGCLPLLLQMPIFFALYNLFSRTIELRQAPFILWIDDLSLPDELVIAGLGIHVLPLLMGVSMFIQQKMTVRDPNQAFLVYFMPLIMVFIFWSMTSGLVLYWTVFNILTIGQQIIANYIKNRSALV